MVRTKPYTERELETLTEAEVQLTRNGLDLSLDTSVGLANGKKLKAKLEETYGDTPVSLANIYAAVRACPDLVWKSKEQMEYERLARQVLPGEIDVLAKVIKSYKLKDTYANRLQILQFILARNMDRGEHGFTLAITNLAAKPGANLEWEPTPAQQSYSPHSGKTRFAQDEVNAKDEQYSGGRLNHARTPQQQTEVQRTRNRDAEYQAKAEALRGSTHNKTAEIQRLFIYKNDGSDVDWAATYAARERIADGRRGSI